MVCHNPVDDHFIDSWRDRPVRCASIWYDAAGGSDEASGAAAGVFLRAARPRCGIDTKHGGRDAARHIDEGLTDACLIWTGVNWR